MGLRDGVDKRLPDSLVDLHIHDVDFIYNLFGVPTNVYATGYPGPTGEAATSLQGMYGGILVDPEQPLAAVAHVNAV